MELPSSDTDQALQAQADYWWSILLQRGEFWIHGVRWDTQVAAFARSINQDYEGDEGISHPKHNGRYTGDWTEQYDVHVNSKVIPTIDYPHDASHGKDTSCEHYFTFENPLKKNLVGFSYAFGAADMGSRGTGALTQFNFRLSTADAHEFIVQFYKNPQLLESLFITRYAPFQFQRYKTGILAVTTNETQIFHDTREDTSRSPLENTKETKKKLQSAIIAQSIQETQERLDFYETNLYVVPFSVTYGTRPWHTGTHTDTEPKHLVESYRRSVIQLWEEHLQRLEHTSTQVLLSEKPLPIKIREAIGRFLRMRRDRTG